MFLSSYQRNMFGWQFLDFISQTFIKIGQILQVDFQAIIPGVVMTFKYITEQIQK